MQPDGAASYRTEKARIPQKCRGEWREQCQEQGCCLGGCWEQSPFSRHCPRHSPRHFGGFGLSQSCNRRDSGSSTPTACHVPSLPLESSRLESISGKPGWIASSRSPSLRALKPSIQPSNRTTSRGACEDSVSVHTSPHNQNTRQSCGNFQDVFRSSRGKLWENLGQFSPDRDML